MIERLLLESPCPHGRFPDPGHVEDGFDDRTMDYRPPEGKGEANHWCPGGERRELTVDWGAAAKEVGMIVRGVLKFGAPLTKHTDIDSKLEGHWAGRIVGAALGDSMKPVVDAALGLEEQ